jgi:hypothetical protein
MKKVIFSLALFLTCSLLGYAQKGISYQAVILDPKPIEIPGQDITGQPFVNGEVSLKFKLFSSTFVQEFEEVHVAKTDAYGLVNVLIGSQNASAFSALVWDINPRSMQVWVSFDNGGTYTKVSEQVLTYTPYALYAETTGTAGKLSGTLTIGEGGTGAKTAANARTNLGLGNVDNTSDANKPVSTATQAALNNKANAAEVNTALATKANAAEVTAALGTKANASDVSASLALKEDVSNKANTPLGTSTTLYPTQNAVKTYVDAQVLGATIADANGSTKGKIQLAGDLGGSAAAPTVPGLALKLDANQKGVANGLATLNSSGIIPSSQLPPVTLSSTTVVANAAEMLGLSSATVGSIAIRTDVAKNFVLRALPASTVGNWIELLTPAAPVQTVNGYTGSVNLAKSDLGLGNVDNTTDASKPISNAAQEALDLKSNAAEVNAALATKMSTADAVAALNLKANAADVNAGLATKLNTADATAALNLKSNTADVAASLNLKLDAIKVGIANGTASLDASGKIPTNQIPAISFSSVNVLGSQAEMLALTTAVVGSVVIRTDVNKNYVLAQANPSLLANWIELLTPAPPVQTVNGYTGTVSLTKSDLGLGNVDNTSDATKPISTATQAALDGKVSSDFVAAAVTAGNAANTAAIVTLNSSVAATTQSIAAANLALAQKAPLIKPIVAASTSTTAPAIILSDANSGNIIYSQWSSKPVFPESLSDGFYCTVVNYSNFALSSNTLTDARFYTNTSGNSGATSFSIPAGGSATVYAIKVNGVQRYYIAAGDQASTFSVADGSITNAKLAGAITASKLVGTDISSVGTVTTGTWNATAIGLANGGTGATTATGALLNLGAAPLASPALTGTPTAPTAPAADNSTKIATTEFVTTAIAGIAYQPQLTLTTTGTGAATLSGTTLNIPAVSSTVSAGTLTGTVAIANGGTGATNAADARTNLGLVIGTHVQAPLAAGTDYLTPTGSAANLTNFPTLNQNTTGNAATATLATTASNVSGVVSGANGGTGVANTGKTITLGGNFQTGHAVNFTTTGSTTLSLPVSGTLATVQQVDAKAPLASPALTGTPTAPTAAVADNSTKIATTEFVQAAVSAGNAGLRTIGAISASSNAKGAVINGASELVLTPADASNGGVVTTGTQTFAGIKTFASNVVANGTNVGKGSGGSSTVLGDAASANDNSSALGFMALNGNGGTNNTAVGTNAMRNSSSTSYTTAVGVIAGQNDNSGNNNTFLGYAASVPNSSAISNSTAIGAGAIVTANNTMQLGADGSNGFAALQNVKTSGTLTAGAVTYPNTNGSLGQVLTANANGSASWTTVGGTLPTTVNTSANYNLVMATPANAALVTGTGNGGTIATLNPNTGQMNVSGLTVQGYGLTSPFYASTPQTLTDAPTIAWNIGNGLNASVTLGGNRTLNFPSTPLAGSYGTLVVTQDATGGRTLTLPAVANKVLGSTSTTTVALSTAPGAKDILNFYYDGTSWYWNVDQGYGSTSTSSATNIAGGAAGSIPYQTGVGATSLLAKGANGTVLTMENNVPAWLTSIRATAGSSYNAAVGFSFLGGDWARNTGMFSDNPDGGGSATLKFRIATSNSTADPYLEISPSKVSVYPITAATSKTTGALTVAGGLGVNGDIYANKLILNSGTAGGASLEVNGASTNTTAFNAASGTSIDFTKSNLAYTAASAGNFTLTGMKDGGTYTLAVQGASSGTAAFTAAGLTLKSVNNAATTANKHTLYTFIVMGTTVYYSMMTGL